MSLIIGLLQWGHIEMNKNGKTAHFYQAKLNTDTTNMHDSN